MCVHVLKPHGNLQQIGFGITGMCLDELRMRLIVRSPFVVFLMGRASMVNVLLDEREAKCRGLKSVFDAPRLMVMFLHVFAFAHRPLAGLALDLHCFQRTCENGSLPFRRLGETLQTPNPSIVVMPLPAKGSLLRELKAQRKSDLACGQIRP